jgi:hypothetical protein
MKRSNSFLMVLAVIALSIPVIMTSCKKDERATTSITLDKTESGPHDIGETVTATVTIVAEDVKSFVYYKVVDSEKSDPVDVTSSLTQSGTTWTYSFSYTLETGDDVGTLGFEFEVTDDLEVMETAAILITTNLSLEGMFIKSDWYIESLTWLGMDVLSAGDAAKTWRFHADGTYDVDQSADTALAKPNHHFCYWVVKETPANGDTLAVLRLIRRVKSGDTALDEYYDYRITAYSESGMTMYWDIAVWGIFDMEQIYKSKPKGAFTPYGTAENAAAVAAFEPFDCSYVDDNLLTID